MGVQVQLEVADFIATITITNPPLAAMDPITIREITEIMPRLYNDDIRVVIFTGGIEGYFIRHYSALELDRAAKIGPDGEARWEGNVHDLLLEIENLPKVVSTALKGTAKGGGWEFAMATDIRVAKDGPYRFGLPEVSAGLVPGAGGTQRLTNLVGRNRAIELMARPRMVQPREAFELGMIEELVPADTTESALDRARSIATEIAARPPLAVAHVKRLVREAVSPISRDMLELEGRLFVDLIERPEAQALIAEIAARHRAGIVS